MMFFVQNSTTANLLTGGEITGGLWSYDDSTVNISGGSIGDNLRAWHTSTVTVSGGSIGGNLDATNHSCGRPSQSGG